MRFHFCEAYAWTHSSCESQCKGSGLKGDCVLPEGDSVANLKASARGAGIRSTGEQQFFVFSFCFHSAEGSMETQPP